MIKRKFGNHPKKPLPTISIVIATFNSERTLKMCLESVKKQEYDKKLIETIIVDGGSNDSTLKIAKKYKTKIINVPLSKQSAEYNKGVGVDKAKNEILLLLDHDNALPHGLWLNKMVKPFMEDKKIVGVEPLRFFYDRKMSILDRYFSLIGGPDPVAYYFGKNSHLSWSFDNYNLAGEAEDKGDYYLVKFNRNRIPALGGNGAAVKRELLLKYAKADPEHFFHIDVHVDLIKKGYNRYGIFKDSIAHYTNNKFFPFLKRRRYFIEKYHFQDQSKRRYSIYEPKKDRVNLIKYVIISGTFIIPVIDSFRGFMKIHDPAWFIHPFICFSMLIVYGVPTVREEVKRIFFTK